MPLPDRHFLRLLRDIRNEQVTLGELVNPNDAEFRLFTVELPWLDNRKRISCIPTGLYMVELDFYHRGGYPAYEVKNVLNRGEIKFHIANYPKDVLGCIGLGLARKPSVPMILQSRAAYDKFMEYMKGVQQFQLELVNAD